MVDMPWNPPKPNHMYLIYMYKKDLALDNLYGLICHETKRTKANQTNNLHDYDIKFFYGIRLILKQNYLTNRFGSNRYYTLGELKFNGNAGGDTTLFKSPELESCQQSVINWIFIRFLDIKVSVWMLNLDFTCKKKSALFYWRFPSAMEKREKKDGWKKTDFEISYSS